MGRYFAGDVLLAPVALDNRTPAKTRPVVVTGTGDDGTIRACPVSSRPPADAPCLPLTLDDFESGGLDLFSESYVMTSRTITLQSGQVIGRKGRVTQEYLGEITGLVHPPPPPGIRSSHKRTGRDHR